MMIMPYYYWCHSNYYPALILITIIISALLSHFPRISFLLLPVYSTPTAVTTLLLEHINKAKWWRMAMLLVASTTSLKLVTNALAYWIAMALLMHAATAAVAANSPVSNNAIIS